MQKFDERIIAEINILAESGVRLNQIVSRSDEAIGGDLLVEFSTWVTRLGQIVRKLYGEQSQHFDSFSKALQRQNFYFLHSNNYDHIAQMAGVAKAVKHDIENGLLVDLKSLVQAEVFADFLEMGEHLLNEGYKDAAAVIIGGVLEDTLRKISERSQIPVVADSGKPLTMDPLNAQLAKAGVYSKLVQKQITTWAHVRNKAAHAEYDEYNAEQVKSMLLFVQSFADTHLS